MKLKTKYLKVDNAVLGADTFILCSAKDYNVYDKKNKKTTDVREGTKYEILVHNPNCEVAYEKLFVKVPTVPKLAEYTDGEEVDCKFTNLQLSVGNVEYGSAEIFGTATKIELVNDEEQKKEIKSFNLNKSKE